MSLWGIKMRGQDFSPCIITLSFSLSLTKECLEFPAPHPTGRAHLTGKGWFPNSQSLLHSWRRLCFGLHILPFILFLIDTFPRVHPYRMLALEGFNNEDILHEGHFTSSGISPVLHTHRVMAATSLQLQSLDWLRLFERNATIRIIFPFTRELR